MTVLRVHIGQIFISDQETLFEKEEEEVYSVGSRSVSKGIEINQYLFIKEWLIIELFIEKFSKCNKELQLPANCLTLMEIKNFFQRNKTYFDKSIT